MLSYIRYTAFAVFLASIYFKLLSFKNFVFFISDRFFGSDSLALIFANIILALEVYIALRFLIDKDIRKTAQYALYLLLFFSLINIYLILLNNVESCFCFGEFLAFSPLESLLKNIILASALVLLYKKSNRKKIKNKEHLYDLLVLSFTIVLFVLANNKIRDFFPQRILIPEISIQKAREKQDDILFIDARFKNFYMASHIKNAIHLPLPKKSITKEFREKAATIFNNNPNKLIVTYCSRVTCGMAQSLAQILKELFPNRKILYLAKGLEGWFQE